MNERRGRNTNFEVAVSQHGLIIRPRTALGRQLMQRQSDLVIALALAELRRVLDICADPMTAIYLDPGIVPG